MLNSIWIQRRIILAVFFIMLAGGIGNGCLRFAGCAGGAACLGCAIMMVSDDLSRSNGSSEARDKAKERKKRALADMKSRYAEVAIDSRPCRDDADRGISFGPDHISQYFLMDHTRGVYTKAKCGCRREPSRSHHPCYSDQICVVKKQYPHGVPIRQLAGCAPKGYNWTFNRR